MSALLFPKGEVCSPLAQGVAPIGECDMFPWTQKAKWTNV